MQSTASGACLPAVAGSVQVSKQAAWSGGCRQLPRLHQVPHKRLVSMGKVPIAGAILFVVVIIVFEPAGVGHQQLQQTREI
jgi:hypothetical protein